MQAGHSVTGTTRSAEKAGSLRAAGADAAVIDALDPVAVAAAVARAQPEVIVHELAAIPPALDVRNFEPVSAHESAPHRGADNLSAASQSVGVRRFVAQSYAGGPRKFDRREQRACGAR
jgi:2-alkyl-3-oxoalkanoate reductase